MLFEAGGAVVIKNSKIYFEENNHGFDDKSCTITDISSHLKNSMVDKAILSVLQNRHRRLLLTALYSLQFPAFARGELVVIHKQ